VLDAMKAAAQLMPDGKFGHLDVGTIEQLSVKVTDEYAANVRPEADNVTQQGSAPA
jgi:hypothetical protein